MTRARHLPADTGDFKQWVEAQVAACRPEDQDDVRRYLRANPGHTLREWKGKGDPNLLAAQPGEIPWKRLAPADVRLIATTTVARCLPQNVRQAAAHDPALIFNKLAKKYRFKTAAEIEAGA